ncbi:hypothetical protein L208DRAFT_1128051, partial [Tricholoma matsutake]
TLRRHIAFKHKVPYHKWCKNNHFVSKLPEDVALCKKEATHVEEEQQETLNLHLRERPSKLKVILYSDELFHQAAIEWLIETDQPIQAFEHPKFKQMIDVAAQATDGVQIPGQKATRTEIMNLFKEQMSWLKEQLNV